MLDRTKCAALARKFGAPKTAKIIATACYHLIFQSAIEEIGKTLGIQVNAAKHTIFRAVRKLRESLEPLVRAKTCNT